MIRGSSVGRRRRLQAIRVTALTSVAPLLLAVGCSTTSETPAAEPSARQSATSTAGTPSATAAPYDVTALRSPGGRLFGVASAGGPGDLGPVTAFAAKTAHQPDVREYYAEWGEDFDPAANATLWHNGQLPMVSWVPGDVPLAQIAAGAQDAHLISFAKQVRSYAGPLAISFAAEMNGDWNAWGPGHATADDYVKAWKHVHDVFRDQQATNVIWVWTPHVTDSASKAALRPYYPGDEYVDWVGLIGYYGPQEGTDYRTLFLPTTHTVRAFSAKPLLIAETGVAESARKAGQIGDLFAGAAGTQGLIGLVWFDLAKQWPGSSQPTDWRVDSSAAAAAAVAKAATDRKFGFPLTKS